MSGTGGIIGGFAGGYMTQNLESEYVFYVTAILGLLVLASGFLMKPHLEAGSEDVILMTFTERSKMIFKEVWAGLKLREMYRSVIFFILLGLIVPNF